MADQVIIESKEHFVKQTYRNRCIIYSANGSQPLIIPIRHQNLKDSAITEIEMQSDEPWKSIHWRSITSAYKRSPFFEFYEDDLKKIFKSEESNLFSFNLNCLKLVFNLLKLPLSYKLTESYEHGSTEFDCRNNFTPKIKNQVNLPRYHQVFEEKHGFIPDLSILDLLCNLGPESKKYLLNF